MLAYKIKMKEDFEFEISSQILHTRISLVHFLEDLDKTTWNLK